MHCELAVQGSLSCCDPGALQVPPRQAFPGRQPSEGSATSTEHAPLAAIRAVQTPGMTGKGLSSKPLQKLVGPQSSTSPQGLPSATKPQTSGPASISSL